MVFGSKISALIGAVCLMGALPITVAYPLLDNHHRGAEFVSMSINQCPDTSRDTCYINYTLPLEFDLKFKTILPFDTVSVYAWYRQSHRMSEASILWSADNACDADSFACPGHEGDERTYLGELDFNGTAEYIPQPGYLNLVLRRGYQEARDTLIEVLVPIAPIDYSN